MEETGWTQVYGDRQPRNADADEGLAADRYAQATAPTTMERFYGISAAEAAEGTLHERHHGPGAAGRARDARAMRRSEYEASKVRAREAREEQEAAAERAARERQIAQIRTAVGNTSIRHLAAPWTACSPPEMRMQGDNPFHTDWLVGAGIPLDEAHTPQMSDATVDARIELQDRLAGWPCVVIVDAGAVVGKVGTEIVVVPDLRPERLLEVVNAQAIITQAGGQLAHLAVISRERGITIMLDPDALRKYPPGTDLRLKPAEGAIEIVVRTNIGGQMI